MSEQTGGGLALDFASEAAQSYGMSLELMRAFQQAAWVCLQLNAHSRPVRLEVKPEGGGMAAHMIDFEWAEPQEEHLRSFDKIEGVEFGATAVALFLLYSLYGYRSFTRSRIGTGFDYWMSKGESVLMNDRERVEISGILTGDVSQQEGRVRAKLGQMAKGVVEGTGYAAVVNFGPPAAKFALASNGAA